jgi:alpha-L-fucosidase
MIMKNELIWATLLMGVLVANAAHYHPPHTDGIETYYHPKELVQWMDTVPEELRPTLFAKEGAMDWWLDARFGIFVHWGPSSMLECSMSWGRHGPRPQHSTDGKVTKGIPQDIYDNQYKLLEAADFNADEWIKLVKDSGAKYFLFTTKHHDGFSTFDTAYSDYDIMNTPFGRDITKEIVDACHKYGIRIGFYYSQPDWNHPLYAAGENEKYCEEFLFPQIRELMTNYGKIDIMWFDGLGRNADTWNSAELLKMIKELQPGIITNHRFHHPPYHAGDLDGPDRSIGLFQTNRPWETCTVIGGGWAWMGDAPAMPLPQAISLLVRCAGGGGNLALGVGPTGDGVFLPDHEKRLREMGEWLKHYGETIYGTQGGPYIPGIWGASTHKDNTVYLHVLANWNGALELPVLPAKIQSLEVLTGGKAEFFQGSEKLVIKMDPANINPVNTLIKLTLDRSASGIAPIKTLGVPVSIGAEATASSERNPNKSAQNVVAADASEFSEGIFVKNSWGPDSKDAQPWLQLKLTAPKSVKQLKLMEGKFGSGSRVQAYEIQALVSNDWKTIHAGTSIGGDCNILLKETVTSDAFRLRILKWDGYMDLNSFELYE